MDIKTGVEFCFLLVYITQKNETNQKWAIKEIGKNESSEDFVGIRIKPSIYILNNLIYFLS